MAVGRKGTIPVEVIRDAVLGAMARDPDLSFTEIAVRLGWVIKSRNQSRPRDPEEHPDIIRLQRLLGLKGRCGKFHETIKTEKAAEIARAVHIDPWEIGV